MKKEKLKKIVIKSVKIILILIVATYGLVGIYSFVFEQDKIAIDRYNFEQLNKSKQTLDKVKTSDRFDNLKEFNNLYGTGIKPIKNCYYLTGNNGNYPYLFGFQLESLLYKLLYMSTDYSYPGYDLLKYRICMGDGTATGGSCIEDFKYNKFKRIISNPCK